MSEPVRWTSHIGIDTLGSSASLLGPAREQGGVRPEGRFDCEDNQTCTTNPSNQTRVEKNSGLAKTLATYTTHFN